MNIIHFFPSTNLADATITSLGIDIKNRHGISVILKLTGSPVGTLSVEASNDDTLDASKISADSWVGISGMSQAVTAADSFMWNFALSHFRWIRFKWTKTSGTGTISLAEACVKPQNP